MSVVFGKPGTIRFRGTFRAQLRRTKTLCQAILNYDTRQGNRNPPVIVLSGQERADFTAVIADCTTLLATLNH